MTDQPRLTDAARAAIEAAELRLQAPEEFGKIEGPATQTEYQRGWNDCRELMLKCLSDEMFFRR